MKRVMMLKDLRKSSMHHHLYLTQTDTTIGFVSQHRYKIDQAKRRKPNKHYICVVDTLASLKSFTRIPTQHKNLLRRAKQTTFILPTGLSFRLVRDTEHNLLLDRLGWAYSSSANLSGEAYSEAYAQKHAEVILSFPHKRAGKASKIVQLSQTNLRIIR